MNQPDYEWKKGSAELLRLPKLQINPTRRRSAVLFRPSYHKGIEKAVGAVEMWKSRLLGFPSVVEGGGKREGELVCPFLRAERFPRPSTTRHFHSAPALLCDTARRRNGLVAALSARVAF